MGNGKKRGGAKKYDIFKKNKDMLDLTGIYINNEDNKCWINAPLYMILSNPVIIEQGSAIRYVSSTNEIKEENYPKIRLFLKDLLMRIKEKTLHFEEDLYNEIIDNIKEIYKENQLKLGSTDKLNKSSNYNDPYLVTDTYITKVLLKGYTDEILDKNPLFKVIKNYIYLRLEEGNLATETSKPHPGQYKISNLEKLHTSENEKLLSFIISTGSVSGSKAGDSASHFIAFRRKENNAWEKFDALEGKTTDFTNFNDAIAHLKKKMNFDVNQYAFKAIYINEDKYFKVREELLIKDAAEDKDVRLWEIEVPGNKVKKPDSDNFDVAATADSDNVDVAATADSDNVDVAATADSDNVDGDNVKKSEDDVSVIKDDFKKELVRDLVQIDIKTIIYMLFQFKQNEESIMNKRIESLDVLDNSAIPDPAEAATEKIKIKKEISKSDKLLSILNEIKGNKYEDFILDNEIDFKDIIIRYRLEKERQIEKQKEEQIEDNFIKKEIDMLGGKIINTKKDTKKDTKKEKKINQVLII